MKFRNFSKKQTIDSSEYSRKKSSLEIIKNARSLYNNSHNSKQYVINFNNANIEWYISYDIFRKFVEGFYIIEPSCNQIAASAPLTIDNARTSEINYDDMFEYVKDEFYESHCTKYDKLLKVSICREESNILYSYGTYFAGKERKTYNFPIQVNLSKCNTSQDPYQWINHCEEPINTTCCESNNPIKQHQHMFPSQYKNYYYSHNHKTHPHNKDGKYIYTNYIHELPFSIFPRHCKDRECKYVKPDGTVSYKITKGNSDKLDN